MDARRGRSGHDVKRLKKIAGLFFALCGVSSSLFAQAWVFPNGGGTVTLIYQYIFVRDHVDNQGNRIDVGHIMAHTLSIDTDYSLTDRLAVKIGVPYVASRYYGPTAHLRSTGNGTFTTIDDGAYHPSFADFT